MWTLIGEQWQRATPEWWEYDVHADKHDLVFNNANHLLLATDGGAYRSTDNGITWEDIENIPATQFYRTAYNPNRPDWYYGGAQDNGTTGGNASNSNNWERIFGGDGFQAVFHPTEPDIFYVEIQRGGINKTLDGGYTWESATEGIDAADRLNWDMQYIMSPHNPDVLYTGTYRVYKSESSLLPFWYAISEDLTDGIDNRYHTISTLSESSINEGLLYVGTSDGRVWRTENGGIEWTEVTQALPKRYVTDLKASPSFIDYVYVTHSGYKDNEFIPRVHRSKDKGATWEDISSNLPDLAINDIYVIPNHQDSLIFVATDGGVYGSINAGEDWERVGTNMPIIAVYDLEWNAELKELVAATFARSIMSYPLEGFNPISTTKPIISKHLNIFPSPASDYIQIEFSNNEIGKQADIVIVNQAGQLIWRQKWEGEGKQTLTIDVKPFPKGWYVVKIKTRHRVQIGRFIRG